MDRDGRKDKDGTPEGTFDGEALGGCELLGMVLGAELFLVVGSVDPRVDGALDREGGAETMDDGVAEDGKTISAEGAIVGAPVRTGALVGLHEMCGAVVVGAAVVGLHEICGAFIVGAMVGDPVGKQEICVVVAGLSSFVLPIRLLFVVVVEVLTAPPGEGL